jgi:TPR repeat protein
MKLKSFKLLSLAAGLLLAWSPRAGQSQVPTPPQNSVLTNLSAAELTGLRRTWEPVSTPDLRRAAEAGDSAAQYFYWARVVNQEHEAETQAFDQMEAAAYGLSNEQRAAAEGKWKTADEVVRSNAVVAGDKGAAMVAFQLEQYRAVDRAAQAFEWLDRSAGQGFPPAEYDTGIYYSGESSWVPVTNDFPKGLKFLQRAADHNWSPAQYKLGMLYAAGEWVPPDLPKAVEYLQKAADQGGPRSAYALAQLYSQGIGEPRSPSDTPILLLRQSATNGYAPACHALAERYRIGLGVPMDYVQAIRYYQAARNQAGSDDIFGLVDDRFQPRPDAGTKWTAFAAFLSVYLQATERSDAAAMGRLGQWYLTGRFMPQDPVAAYYWFDRAASLGAATAAEKRDALRARLRPEQLEQAAKINGLGP